MNEELIVYLDDQVAGGSSSVNMSPDLLGECGISWGTITFEDILSNDCTDGRPFVYVDDRIDSNVLYDFMVSEWKLSPANIVISVVSGITNHKPFKSLKMVETLSNGIKNICDASEVWFITNGIDAGLPQLIGSVVQDNIALRRTDDAWAQRIDGSVKVWKALILVGIVCDEEMKDVVNLLRANGKGKKDIKICIDKRVKYSLNSNHTHFIIIREKPNVMISSNVIENKSSITDSGEKVIDLSKSKTNRFRDRFESFLHEKARRQTTRVSPSPSRPSNGETCNRNSSNDIGFPMVCILVRGTLGTIEIFNEKVQQEIPGVILKGSGSAADIISFVYDEISAKNNKNCEDENLKSELSRRLLDEYPSLKDNIIKRNEIRDQIITIVKKNDQSKQKFLTFVDINSSTVSLNDFHKFIFTGYLQAKKIVIENKVNVEMQDNLLGLTLDWGLVDFARSEIFPREDFIGYVIPKHLFEKALLGKNLEEFVDLFLEQNFVLHRYLNVETFRNLFDKEKDRDFFTITSLEGILGWTGDDNQVPDNFIEDGLTNIVHRLTGLKKAFSKLEMQHNSMSIYFGTTEKNIQLQEMVSETEALRYLVIYAVLINRHNLSKILWKRSSEPIPLALICCMILNKLIPYCRELYLQSLIKKQAKEFSDCAIGVLDKSVEDNESRISEMLHMKHPDWNNMTIVQLAYNSDNKEFMAHAILQKWVNRKFYGEITPSELSWGFLTCPEYLKIIVSAFLIFPMRFWISFSPIGQCPSTSEKNKDLSEDKKIDFQSDANHEDNQLRDDAGKVNVRQSRGCFTRLRSHSCLNQRTSTDEKTKSCFQKIQILWSAPITKFYTNFVAYLLFLFLFTLAVMWPSCGHLFLDCVVWIWAASIVFENIRIGYVKYCSQSNLPLVGVIIEIIVQVTFLSLYLGVRIFGLWKFGTCQILTAKSILGVGLIYYYYRILFIYLPISSRFGPMMIRLQYMITDDFFTFLRLFVIFMISSGVAITAVLYPHHPLDWNLFSKAIIFRGLMALFTSDMSDLKKVDEHCTINATTDADKKNACLRLSNSFRYDNMYAYQRYGISSPFCNQTSWVAWFLLIQYFFLAKRFLISLLTALFSLTGARVQRQSEQIWFYNRYAILAEYTKRPRLPPPFIIISYIIELINIVYFRCILRLKKYSDERNDMRQVHAQSRAAVSSNMALASMPLVPEPTVASDDVHLNPRQLNASSSMAYNDRSLLKRLLNSKPCRRVIQDESVRNNNQQKYWENGIANNYWKHKAKEYFIQSQAAEKAKDKSNSAINVQKDIDVIRKFMQQTNDRIVTLEKMMIHSHVLLEKICAIMPQENKASSESLKKFVHIHSRVSPYVYTNDARFPLTEKFVPWEIPFELYDPTLITLPKEHICFSDNDRPFVEPSFSKLSSAQLNSSEPIEMLVTTVDTNDFNIPLSQYKWNQIVELKFSDDKKIIVDRTSWITQPNDGTSIIYQLDAQLLVPLNPLGRTGVRGRGALIRWGPNKSIMAIITRWKKLENEFVTVEGKRILEAMIFTDKNTNNCKFCEAKLLGEESPYGAVCRLFNKLAFQDENYEQSLSLQKANMIEFFESFTHLEEVIDQPTEFESHMIYRGYIDDVRNTDNAWMETEIWNFHYGSTLSFPHLRIDGTILWKNVTHNFRSVSIQTSILREIARIHDAYFE